MKMSKSIHDYKEAMDNIKISESFYKRTEVLLTELPEVKIEKRPILNSRRISAVIMSAAACVICLFGVKLAVDGRQSDIATETVTDTDGGVLTDTESKGADELIDDLTGYDDGGIIAESISPDGLDGGKAQDDNSVPTVKPATSPETEVPAANPAAETTAAAPTAEVKTTSATAATTAVTTEKRVVEGIDPYGVTAGSTAKPTDEDVDEDEVAEPIPNPGVFDDNDDDVMDDEPAAIEEVPDTDNDEAAPAAGASEPLLFGELSLDKVTVDVTPYFNMGDIKSGESTVKKGGTEFKPVLDLIANIEDGSAATKITNGSFTSLFSVRIYDANIDLDFYSIYLTNHESIVITKHSPDGSQVRETYALRREHYESVRHQLFLLFGAEEDYELFLNLIGGK